MKSIAASLRETGYTELSNLKHASTLRTCAVTEDRNGVDDIAVGKGILCSEKALKARRYVI